jgi:probable phosphoglycerate mutase
MTDPQAGSVPTGPAAPSAQQAGSGPTGPAAPSAQQAGSVPTGPAAPSAPPAGRVILARHGETEWSASGQHTGGKTDIPLTPHGEEQAKALGPLLARSLRGRQPALALTSPLQRAARTAGLAGVPAEPDPDLCEVDYGDFDGLTTPQIRVEHPGWTVWSGLLPHGETLTQVAERADRVLARVRAALPAGDVVLFGHGHLLRILAARWLELPPDGGRLLALNTATLSILGTEHGGPVLARWNLPNPLEDAP